MACALTPQPHLLKTPTGTNRPILGLNYYLIHGLITLAMPLNAALTFPKGHLNSCKVIFCFNGPIDRHRPITSSSCTLDTEATTSRLNPPVDSGFECPSGCLDVKNARICLVQDATDKNRGVGLPSAMIVGFQRIYAMVHRSKTPKPSDLIPWAEIDGPRQSGDPKSEVDKNGGESHTNLLWDAWQAMSGRKVWDGSWWALVLQSPLFPPS